MAEVLTPELIELIEASRSLGMKIVIHDGQEVIKVPGNAKDFPRRLMHLQRSLEAYDKASGKQVSGAVGGGRGRKLKPSFAAPKWGAKVSSASKKLGSHRAKALERANQRLLDIQSQASPKGR